MSEQAELSKDYDRLHRAVEVVQQLIEHTNAESSTPAMRAAVMDTASQYLSDLLEQVRQRSDHIPF